MQAEPEKTREVGWGKGKGNWIRGAAVLEGPRFSGGSGAIACGLCCPFRREGAVRIPRYRGKEDVPSLFPLGWASGEKEGPPRRLSYGSGEMREFFHLR